MELLVILGMSLIFPPIIVGSKSSSAVSVPSVSTLSNVTSLLSRPKRQILQVKTSPAAAAPAIHDHLPHSTTTTLYLQFIRDLTTFHGWSSIHILTEPQDEHHLCPQFIAILAQSTPTLRTGCGPDDHDFGARDMITPIFYFYKPPASSAPPVPLLLVPYRPTRPNFLFTSLPKHQVITEVGAAVGLAGNYKWTLVSSGGGKEGVLGVEDVYGFVGAPPVLQAIGEWSLALGLNIDTQLALGPTDFQGRTLRITTAPGPPLVFVSKSSSHGVKSSGYLPDILHSLSRQLNFTYVVVTPADNKFGNIEANGSWNGMVGMLQRMEAEIAMMSFSLTAARKSVMDFSPPVEYSSVRLLIRRDWQNAELKWSAYLRPLAVDVWLTIPLFLVIGVITLAIFSYFKILDITLFKSAWLLSSCFILQGQDAHSAIKVTPYRLVLGTFWILSVVVFASYTARLTAYLAASNEILPISSLQQAVNNKNWKVGLVKSSAFVDRIRESRVEVLRALSQRIAEDPSALVETFQDGMDRVFKERYIFFTSELTPSFLISSNCSYTWLPDKYFSGFGYMGYQKNLPYAPVISQRLAQLRGSGQMRRLFKKWWGTDSVCFTNSGESFLGMSLYETGTAFLILLVGLGCAITLIMGELFFVGRGPSKSQDNPSNDKQPKTKSTENINSLDSKFVKLQTVAYKSDFSF